MILHMEVDPCITYPFSRLLPCSPAFPPTPVHSTDLSSRRSCQPILHHPNSLPTHRWSLTPRSKGIERRLGQPSSLVALFVQDIVVQGLNSPPFQSLLGDVLFTLLFSCRSIMSSYKHETSHLRFCTHNSRSNKYQ